MKRMYPIILLSIVWIVTTVLLAYNYAHIRHGQRLVPDIAITGGSGDKASLIDVVLASIVKQGLQLAPTAPANPPTSPSAGGSLSPDHPRNR